MGELEKRANFQYYQLVMESHANYTTSNTEFKIFKVKLLWLFLTTTHLQLFISEKRGVIRVENCPATSVDINMKERVVQLFGPDV